MVRYFLPWGESIYLLDSQPTPLLLTYLILSLSAVGTVAKYPLSLLRAGRSREAAFLFVAIGFFTGSFLFDFAIVFGLFNFFYLTETGYVGIALTIGLLVMDEVVKNAKLKHSLDLALAEKDVLIAEINHRVRNNLAVLHSLTRLQADTEKEPHIRSRLSIMESRIRAITSAHDLAYERGTASSIEIVPYLVDLALASAIAFEAQDIVVLARDGYEGESADSPIDLRVTLDLAVPLGLLANEVFDNVLRHGFRTSGKGRICVFARVRIEEAYACSNSN